MPKTFSLILALLLARDASSDWCLEKMERDKKRLKKKKTRRGTGAHLLKYYPIGPCKERPFIKILSHWSLQGAKEQMASKRNNILLDVGSRNDSLLIWSCSAKFLHTRASQLGASFSTVGPIFLASLCTSNSCGELELGAVTCSTDLWAIQQNYAGLNVLLLFFLH